MSLGVWLVKTQLLKTGAQAAYLHDPELWHWETAETRMLGWEHSSAEWRNFLKKPCKMDEKLNNKWGIDWHKESWKEFWRKLRSGPIFLRDKTWVWKIIHNGLFVDEKLIKMKLGERFLPEMYGEKDVLSSSNRSATHSRQV
ncbi:hypothetical protein R1sor_009567 [Riccia sorocarpa]|uniref:Uncharacterized protein n=1 Tax=Riccia sorocarpa TaxID=122646 RepID=A0ABD3HX06_9MARC